MWFEHEVKPRLRGRAFEVRYADDAVLVFQHEEDARRVLGVLAKRLGKYGLRLHPEKTRMVEFCRPSKSKRGGSQREHSFAMLGFTHYWGRSRKGRWVVKRKTAKDRFSRAVRAMGQWCRTHRHWLTERAARGVEPQAAARPLCLLRTHRQRPGDRTIPPRGAATMAQMAESSRAQRTAVVGAVHPPA